MGKPVKLTKAQMTALAALARSWKTPAGLGEAITGGLQRSGYPMKPQGLGRIGGAMGTRLMRKGLAQFHHKRWPTGGLYIAGYEITDAGRAAYDAALKEEAGHAKS